MGSIEPNLLLCNDRKMREVSDQQHLPVVNVRAAFWRAVGSIVELGLLRRTAPLIFNMRVPGANALFCFLYPHLRIKYKTSAYIRHLL